MNLQWINDYLRQCINALVRLSLNRESHENMVMGPSGNYMQVIIEYIDDLIYFGFKKWEEDFKKLVAENNTKARKEKDENFVDKFKTITGIVTLFTNCMCSRLDVVQRLKQEINSCVVDQKDKHILLNFEYLSA